jgi:hypothetical protein
MYYRYLSYFFFFFFLQTVAVGVIKATTPNEVSGVTTKSAQKVRGAYMRHFCQTVLKIWAKFGRL